MTTTPLNLEDIRDLAFRCLKTNGADDENASPLADVIFKAERDGSHSHGLFRLPAYVASLRSGKVKGNARPSVEAITPALLRLDGDCGYAPHAHQVGIPVLCEAAKKMGIAAMSVRRSHHMASLWPEVEMIAQANLFGLTCTNYMSCVAPHGAKESLFGTNPLAFAWPRPNQTPVVCDMATASMAMGEVQIAARDGHSVPMGTGLDKDGHPTDDPNAIINGGVLSPFGGHKGSAIAMLVELLTAGLSGEGFSNETKAADSGDGGPPVGGQLLLAISPAMATQSADWEAHCEAFFSRYLNLQGHQLRLPGARRHKNRISTAPRNINTELLEKIKSLM